MRRTLLLITVAFLALLAIALLVRARAGGPAPEPVVAFPGAEGFGAYAQGGRGGRVMLVTTLADSGPGSLRACAEGSGPRTCIFRVAGTIEVESRIDIWEPYLTIAGQSAPGGGITLRNGPGNRQAPLGVLAHDVIIRYLRFRPGPSPLPSGTVDGITIVHETDSEHPGAAVYNVIIDHCSFSWASDELVNSWNDVSALTIQWSIVAEALHCSTHPEGCLSKGMLIGSKGAERISVHHNLFAHNRGRNPFIATSGLVELVNNVIFIPRQVAIAVDGRFYEEGGSPIPANLIGNLVIAPYGDGLVYGVHVLSEGIALYLEDNLGPFRSDDAQEERAFLPPEVPASLLAATPFAATTPVARVAARELAEPVLAGAGATLGVDEQGTLFWRRDEVDERIVAEVRAGEAHLIDDPAEVGGWPELDPGIPVTDEDRDGMADPWELAHFGTLARGSPEESSGDFDGDGFTDLEEYLNGTEPVAVARLPLARLARQE